MIKRNGWKQIGNYSAFSEELYTISASWGKAKLLAEIVAKWGVGYLL